MNTSPAVSIVVPIYQVEKYLKKCLQSLAVQTSADLEVLMIDDGSTDGSSRIAKRFADSDPRFKYFHQENAGLGAARNKGLSLSRAELIMWVDSDDVLLPGCLAQVVPLMQSGPDDYVSFGVYRYSDRSQRLLHSSLHQFVHKSDLRHVRPSDCQHIFRDSTAWNKVFRKSFFEQQVGGWEEGVLFEDLFPVCRAICAAKSVSILSNNYYVWRARAARTSITQQRTNIAALTDRFVALKAIARHLKDQPAEMRGRFLDKFFTIDYKIYQPLLGQGDETLDTAFFHELTEMLDIVAADLSHARLLTTEQRHHCDQLCSQDRTTPQFDNAPDLSSVPEKCATADDGDFPDQDVVAFQHIGVGKDSIDLDYLVTLSDADVSASQAAEHAIVVELQRSGYRCSFRPSVVAVEDTRTVDRSTYSCRVTISFDSLLEPDLPTDFNYGRHWREKTFSVSILWSPDTDTRIQPMRFGQAEQILRAEERRFDTISVHKIGKGMMGFTLHRKHSALQALGRIKERLARAFVY